MIIQIHICNFHEIYSYDMRHLTHFYHVQLQNEHMKRDVYKTLSDRPYESPTHNGRPVPGSKPVFDTIIRFGFGLT